jgi:hypothetical protein
LAVVRMRSLVFAATCCESGASFKTMETVEAEKPDSRATSRMVTCRDGCLRLIKQLTSEVDDLFPRYPGLSR